jgi:phage-related protein
MLEKPVEWVASSKKDLMSLPAQVIDKIGYALCYAQMGYCKGA